METRKSNKKGQKKQEVQEEQTTEEISLSEQIEEVGNTDERKELREELENVEKTDEMVDEYQEENTGMEKTEEGTPTPAMAEMNTEPRDINIGFRNILQAILEIKEESKKNREDSKKNREDSNRKFEEIKEDICKKYQELKEEIKEVIYKKNLELKEEIKEELKKNKHDSDRILILRADQQNKQIEETKMDMMINNEEYSETCMDDSTQIIEDKNFEIISRRENQLEGEEDKENNDPEKEEIVKENIIKENQQKAEKEKIIENIEQTERDQEMVIKGNKIQSNEKPENEEFKEKIGETQIIQENQDKQTEEIIYEEEKRLNREINIDKYVGITNQRLLKRKLTEINKENEYIVRESGNKSHKGIFIRNKKKQEIHVFEELQNKIRKYIQRKRKKKKQIIIKGDNRNKLLKITKRNKKEDYEKKNYKSRRKKTI